MGRARTTGPTPYVPRPTVNGGLADCGHAGHATYVAGRCRCDACRAANNEYERKRRRREAYGRQLFVDADLARAELARVTAMGITYDEIWRLTGGKVGHTWLHSLTRFHPRTGRPVTRCLRENYEALKAIDGTRRMPSEGQRVDATWAGARVQAWVRAGLSQAAIARACGLDRQVVDALAHGTRERVRASTFVAVARNADECEAECPREPVYLGYGRKRKGA